MRAPHHLLEVLLGLGDAGDILEGDGGLVPAHQPRPRLAKGKGLAVDTLSLAEEKIENAPHEQHG